MRSEPALKHSRWMWLTNRHGWSKRQIARHHDLSRMHLKTGRASRLKEALRDIFAAADTRADAEARFTAWIRWARRSRLEPFSKLARALKAQCEGILNGFDSALTDGSVEAINGLVQAAKARARGYRKPEESHQHVLPDRGKAQPPASLTLPHNIRGRSRMTEPQPTHTKREIATEASFVEFAAQRLPDRRGPHPDEDNEYVGTASS